jgi:D-xylono/L-arabinono-1,4-lactonase
MSSRAPSLVPELIADYGCVCGEIPIWHPDEKCLYWADVPTGRLFRYDPAARKHEMVWQGENIGGIALQADGSLLLLMENCIVRSWRNGAATVLVEKAPPGEEKGRWNDCIADPEGRLYCGTLPTEERKGNLYRLDRDGTYTRMVEGVGCTNGLAFTPDLRGLYYADSATREIFLFDYHRDTGALTNKRVFLHLPESLGAPDGLTVDAKGHLWVAVWAGSCMVRYTPRGEESERIYFTGKLVSCPAFGGGDYRELYVTTAGGDNKKDNGAGAGALFRVRPGVKGVPEFRTRIKL